METFSCWTRQFPNHQLNIALLDTTVRAVLLLYRYSDPMPRLTMSPPPPPPPPHGSCCFFASASLQRLRRAYMHCKRKPPRRERATTPHCQIENFRNPNFTTTCMGQDMKLRAKPPEGKRLLAKDATPDTMSTLHP